MFKYILIVILLLSGIPGLELFTYAIEHVDLNKSETHLLTHWTFSPADSLPPKEVTLPASIETITGSMFGSGTFSTKVCTDKKSNLAIHIGNQKTVYRVLINGVVIDSNGDISNHSLDYIPHIKFVKVPIPVCDTILVQIEFSNYYFRLGGVTQPIYISEKNSITETESRDEAIDLIIAGSIFFMGFYHFFLYILIKRERSSMYFGIFCLLMGLRSLLVNNVGIMAINPNIDPYYIYVVEQSTAYCSSLFGLFSYYLFPKYLPKKLAQSYIGFTIIYIIVNMLVTPRHLLDVMYSYDIILSSQLIILTYYAVKIVIKKEEGSKVYFVSYILLLIAVINDIAVNYIVFSPIQIVPITFILFLLAQSYTISRRFANSFVFAEKLSGELLDKNRDLNRLSIIKDEFLANTSHELRTPINGIVGIAEAIKTSIGDCEEKGNIVENIDLIVSSGRRLNRVVNDILDFSKLKNRDLQLEKRDFTATPIITDIVKIFSIMYATHAFEIELDIKEPIYVFGDAERFYQMLYNLIGNSCKFTKKGFVKLQATSNEKFAIFSVEDSGIGISEEKLSIIFDPFEQGEHHETKQYGGTGLGLSITKSLVELHGGRIEAESIVGVGSKFTVYLPKGKPVSSSNFTHKNADSSFAQSMVTDIPDNCDILVVDDEKINLEIVKQHLEQDGFSVGITTDPKYALTLIRNLFKPKVLILDVMMPEISGYDVCTEIRELYSTIELPIVMLTAKNRVEDLYKGFACGANDYISKPFYSEELKSRVRTFSKLSDSYRALLQNEQLKNEIVSKEEQEKRLKESNERINAILDSVETALIGIDNSGMICYYNESFQHLLTNNTQKIVGLSINELLPNIDLEKEMDTLEVPIFDNKSPFMIKKTRLKLSYETITILMFKNKNEMIVESEQLISTISTSNESMQEILKYIETNNSNRAVIHDIAQSIIAVADKIAGAATQESQARESGVAVMNAALELWSKSTGKTKQDFARESALWRVQMNHNGWERTQTLDKYLLVATLPKSPKWMLVIKSVTYIIDNIPASHEKSNLEKELKSFTSIVSI